jgi:hypothetical protein
MKIRTGRRNSRNLYLQLGDEPGDGDPCIGFMIDTDTGALIADAITSPWHLNEIMLSAEDREKDQARGPFAAPPACSRVGTHNCPVTGSWRNHDRANDLPEPS